DHSSQRLKKGKHKLKFNWSELDALIAGQVKNSAIRLKQATGRPLLVSKTAIAWDFGQLRLIERRIDNLPLTAKMLSEAAETREMYAIRRIWWAANCYRQEGVFPPQWRLYNRAGLRREIVADPEVRNEL